MSLPESNNVFAWSRRWRSSSSSLSTNTTKAVTKKMNDKNNNKTILRRRTSSVETVQSDVTRNEIVESDNNHHHHQPRNGMPQLQEDVWPLILSYCGPQEMNRLAEMHPFFQSITKKESTWRVLCEQLYKWKPGEEEPHSWKEYYRTSPCVPIDYPTIPAAIAAIAQEEAPEPEANNSNNSSKNPFRRNHATSNAASTNATNNNNNKNKNQVRSVRILLRPGTYCLSNTVQVQALPGVVIQLETMEMPIHLFYNKARNRNMQQQLDSSSSSFMEDDILEQPLPAPLPLAAAAASTKRPSFKKLWSCNSHRRRRGGHEFPPEDTDYTEDLTELEDFHHRISAINSANAKMQPVARLILRSRRHNEPVFCVRQGILVLKNVEIQHNSHGLDIWNGNAAVQIQPSTESSLEQQDNDVRTRPRPMAFLERVQVTSRSGRGIVNIDGGRLCMRNCIVRDCAATGIYIGGPGSAAFIESTDVIGNGIGNYPTNATTRHHRRGIARGHSGIYLEQGEAQIRNSTVINNTLTGVSVVSPDNATLELSHSMLAGNGTFQLELPPNGSASRERCELNDNTLNNESRPFPLQDIPLRSGLNLSTPTLMSPLTTTTTTTTITNPAALPVFWHPPQQQPHIWEHVL